MLKWQSDLPPIRYSGKTQEKTLLIVRLDDIGDYLLFRPALKSVRTSEKFKGWKIRLLGNKVWEDLFYELDKDFVDEFIPFDKSRWFQEGSFRSELIQLFSENQPEYVWLPSRTRHIFLEDFLVQAFSNSIIYSCGNAHSDYTQKELKFIEKQSRTEVSLNSGQIHEWRFNQELTLAFCLKNEFSTFSIQNEKEGKYPYIILFPGASSGSKRWSTSYFSSIASVLLASGQYQIRIAGSAADSILAEEILSGLKNQDSIFNDCGKTNLVALLHLIQGASLVISNDTSAAHMAALSGIPTIVLANGNKFGRFFPYPDDFSHVSSFFPKSKIPLLYPDRYDLAEINPKMVLDFLTHKII